MAGFRNGLLPEVSSRPATAVVKKSRKQTKPDHGQAVLLENRPELLPECAPGSQRALENVFRRRRRRISTLHHNRILGSTTMYSRSDMKVPISTRTADMKLTVRMTG